MAIESLLAACNAQKKVQEQNRTMQRPVGTRSTKTIAIVRILESLYADRDHKYEI
jgi:hypothetical protein